MRQRIKICELKENIKSDIKLVVNKLMLHLGGIIVSVLGNLKKSQGFMRGLIIFLAATLVIGGPTYFMYILDQVELPRLLILVAGLASLTSGLVLFTYILKVRAHG